MSYTMFGANKVPWCRRRFRSGTIICLEPFAGPIRKPNARGQPFEIHVAYEATFQQLTNTP